MTPNAHNCVSVLIQPVMSKLKKIPKNIILRRELISFSLSRLLVTVTAL